MDTPNPISLNHLPPHKRLRFMQDLQHHTPSSSSLPAKKRKESRNAPFLHDPPPSPPRPTICSLPAKKRVCALHPHFASHFDLNVEYNPSLEHHQKPTSKIQFCDYPSLEHQNTNKTPSPQKPTNKNQFFDDPSPQKPQKHKLEDNDNGDVDDDGILCCVCQSTDGASSDPIVFCDGCDLMVHASCYGNPLSKGIPEGDWFCERCRFNRIEENSGFASSCCLCPVKEGAMKKTTDHRWAHIVCAVLVPEVFFLDPEGREGIDCSKVPKKRWLERCYVCDSCDGCGVVCSEPKCGLAFHVTCGLKEELCIEYREGKKGATIVAGFCKTHSQIWEKQQQSGKYKIVALEDIK